jgi:ParB/RepB/Spo0J family partition protein
MAGGREVSLAGIEPELARVAHALIDEPEIPSRDEMDERKMDELVADMRANGFTSTVLLFRKGDRYGTIAGNRRWHAAKRAGIAFLPALIFPCYIDELDSLQFGENEHREDLSPASEAVWYAQLLEKRPAEGTDGLAARLHVTRDRVERRLALLLGDEQIFAALRAGRINVGVAEQLNRCNHEMYRRSLLDQALHSHPTVATVSSWIADWKRTMEPALANVPGDGTPVTTGIAIQNNYFTCHLCNSKNNPANMRPVQVHDYCIQAVLTPALALWNGRKEAVPFPRTLREAHALIDKLIEHFPEIVPDDSAPA